MGETNINSLFDLQESYIAFVNQWNNSYKLETGHVRKAFCLTMGCQMNAHDSEKLIGMLQEMGYEITQTENDADFIIYNTCCIRANAEEKVYGRLGWLKTLKKRNPNLILAICGCMVQQNEVVEKIDKTYGFVDILFGTYNLYKLPELLSERIKTSSKVRDIWTEQKEIVEEVPTVREHKFKASVNIMYGCDNFCTYCVVPYVRGRERSRRREDIIKEVEALALGGVKEVMLLGQNVNSYGKNLESPTSFAQLLRDINQIDGIERIRFMTSHPKDLSDELIYAMRDCKKVCNYLHLPMQSGSSRLLNKMNRRYTKEQYLSLVDKIRHEIPDISLSTDIIVGFPGETEKDFEETIDVVKKCGFSSAFTFIYSKRPGTPAAAMDCQIDEETAHKRFNRLLDVLNTSIHNTQETKIGKTYNVLAEKESDKAGIITGRAEDNTLIHFNGGTDLIGNTIPVKITENKTFYLIGERI